MKYPAFPVFGFLAAALVIFPVPRLVRARNIAGIALVYWIFQSCIIIAVDSIIWAGNVNNSAPLWCEITIKLKTGSPVGVSAATLCITRHLEFITSRRSLSTDFLQRNRNTFETFMCFGLPVVWMSLYYVFHMHDYGITEDFGCSSEWYPSFAVFAILFIPPLVLSAGTIVLGAVSLYHLLSRRTTKAITPYLMSRDPALSCSQTIRLIILSMVLGIPGALWAVGNYQQLAFVGLKPFPEWSTLHKHANNIVSKTEHQISAVHTTSLLIRRWSIFAQAYIVFFLFGTSKDLLRDYQIIWVLFKARVLKQPLQETMGWKTKKMDVGSLSGVVPSPSSISIRVDVESSQESRDIVPPPPPVSPFPRAHKDYSTQIISM